MFEATGFALDGDHLDLSFRATEGWPDLGVARSLWVQLGDPVAGPAFQLVAADPLPEMMWMPGHYHGSDQFRLPLRGELVVANHTLAPGSFGFQEAGRPYREGGGTTRPEGLWIFGLMGYGRGARTTWTGAVVTDFPLDLIGDDQFDRPIDLDDAWWGDVPGGAKGVTAVSTSLGSCTRGYLWGSFDDTRGWQEAESAQLATALLGDPVAGPVLVLVQDEAGGVVVPGHTLVTETVLLVVEGMCGVGSSRYVAGDLRVQAAWSPLDDVVAGSEGVRLMFLVADRRALVDTTAAAGPDGWLGTLRSRADDLGTALV